MHEIHLLKDILNRIDLIAREHSSQKVEKVNIWLGALAHISDDHLREHFLEESRGRICEGAELQIEVSTDLSHPHAQDIRLERIDVA